MKMVNKHKITRTIEHLLALEGFVSTRFVDLYSLLVRFFLSLYSSYAYY